MAFAALRFPPRDGFPDTFVRLHAPVVTAPHSPAHTIKCNVAADIVQHYRHQRQNSEAERWQQLALRQLFVTTPSPQTRTPANSKPPNFTGVLQGQVHQQDQLPNDYSGSTAAPPGLLRFPPSLRLSLSPSLPLSLSPSLPLCRESSHVRPHVAPKQQTAADRLRVD